MMLLYYLFTCLSCIIFVKSLALKPLPPWAEEMRLLSLSLWFWRDLPFNSICRALLKKPKTPKSSSSNGERDSGLGMSILDLPDLALDCILEKLPPAELCDMAGVCTSLREMCTSDRLWERHMRRKWDKVLGPGAYREWQRHVACLKNSGNLEAVSKPRELGLNWLLSFLWPLRSLPEVEASKKTVTAPLDSVMSWYLALEDGKFWFPAQVYNRENGHVGFMLSCYDADLIYDSATDTFQARYPPHGKKAAAVENGVSWDRLRAPPTDTSPLDLHITDCLNELRPGDHIEIQWRRNIGFPYGWWYGVVGHLDSCDGNADYCLCHDSDIIKLEFGQYTRESRWRSTTVNRRDHREDGNGERGFYGGIRKLTNDAEIRKWRHFCPNRVLDMS